MTYVHTILRELALGQCPQDTKHGVSAYTLTFEVPGEIDNIVGTSNPNGSQVKKNPRERLRASDVVKTLKETSKFIGRCCNGRALHSPTPPRIELSQVPSPVSYKSRPSLPSPPRTEQNVTQTASAMWSELPTQSETSRTRSSEGASDAIAPDDPLTSSQRSASSRSFATPTTDDRSSIKAVLGSIASNVQGYKPPGGEDLDLETELLSYSIARGCLTSAKSEGSPGENALQLLLYRTRKQHIWQTTRRMIITNFNAETQSSWYHSSWLPLADIRLRIDGDTLFVSWSDCDHKVDNSAKDFHRTHSKKYDGANANNEILLRFAHSAECSRVFDAFCSIPRTGDEIQPPDSMPLSSGHSLHIFEVFEDSEGANDMPPEHVMLIRNRDNEDTMTTRLFLVPNDIDFSIAPQKTPSDSWQYQVTLSGLKRPTYLSDAQNLSAVSDRIGHFSATELRSRSAVFIFEQDAGESGFIVLIPSLVTDA